MAVPQDLLSMGGISCLSAFGRSCTWSRPAAATTKESDKQAIFVQAMYSEDKYEDAILQAKHNTSLCLHADDESDAFELSIARIVRGTNSSANSCDSSTLIAMFGGKRRL